MLRSLVGSEMCIRDSLFLVTLGRLSKPHLNAQKLSDTFVLLHLMPKHGSLNPLAFIIATVSKTKPITRDSLFLSTVFQILIMINLILPALSLTLFSINL
eukprot:TRINITY_DN685_c0_g5_i1.p3 TRINITY_DN685_c0_g5~~TRINITY_DN685_c0_g5_i1.p3  ORF type:complete len:100 (-),score=16.15 TRINITY_DN685_c0_g5_i1:12-311(-)